MHLMKPTLLDDEIKVMGDQSVQIEELAYWKAVPTNVTEESSDEERSEMKRVIGVWHKLKAERDRRGLPALAV
jgi:hypothetical protein